MKLNILFGGPAGYGLNQLAKLFSLICSSQGLYIFNYRDYGSLIRGSHSFNIVSISDKQINSHDLDLDIIIALDENTINFHKKELKKQGIIISPKDINAEKIIKENNLNKIVINTIFLGALTKVLGLNLNEVITNIKKEFGKEKFQSQNIKAAQLGYKFCKDKQILKQHIKKIQRKILDGSEAISLSCLNSGVDLYYSYPMTPSTPVLHYLANKQNKNFMIFQPENEISTINMALGSSFTGAKVMVGTSGGGFDLMTEAISMQGITELPLIVYLAARPGPGTGVPTYTMQQDINIALYSGHGEFPRVVISPGNSEEAYKAVNDSIYLSQKYRILTILLGDKHLAESQSTIDSLPKIKPIPTYYKITEKNYQFTQSGLSPRNLPNLNIAKTSSNFHDEYGIVTEDPILIEKIFDKLNKKTKTLEKEIFSKFETIKTYGKGKNLIIATGSVKGAIIDSLEELKAKFLHIIYLQPLDINKIQKEIKKAKKIFVVEINSTGQLSNLIEDKFKVKVHRILKYDARPITPKELIKKIKNENRKNNLVSRLSKLRNIRSS